MSRPLFLCLVFGASCCSFSQRADAQQIHDVVIYGGTSAAVSAAVQVKRMHKSVIVVSPDKHLGGLTTGGLGWTDSGRKDAIGGISREFYQRLKKHYDQPSAWKYEKPSEYSRYRPNDDAIWTFEPHVAEQAFDQLIAEYKITVAREEWLDRENGVAMEGKQIVSITTVSGKTYRGRVFMDATYEGDLMAAAGVSYATGREANSQYNETLNGVQKQQNTHSHRFVKAVDPYVKAGDPTSGLLPGVHGKPPGQEGAADHRIQAYCFRMCMSNVAENRVPFPKPHDYDQQRYELLLRNFEAGDLRFPMKPDMMPNGKTDTNNNCAFSTDNIGMNYDYPEATYEERQKIIAEHESYQKGLMWTLANHPRVPASIRDKMSRWGLAKDEFTDHGNWPHQIYVREARRMRGDFVMTERHLRAIEPTPASVGMGSYNMDSHNVQRYIDKNGHVQNEGDVQVSAGGAYPISYRALVPKNSECTNLLVPVCVSSSHIAYGSIRMEPVFMILGQSAATAACMSIDESVSVQDLDYEKLRKQLLADGQVLHLERRPQASVRRLTALKGIVLDDIDAERIGVWSGSASVGPVYGIGYIHDGNEDKGTKQVVFTPKIRKAGRFEVRLLFSAHANRATNVGVTIETSADKKTVRVNQRKAPEPGPLFSLGVYAFDVGTTGTITISNADTNGYVIVDAVQLLPTD